MSMKQLSGLDATFLYLETPEMPMHVGALHLLELPEGYKGRYVKDLRRHLQARMPATPALRRRLWWMPLNLANPAWVDAEPDLDEHVVEIRLGKDETRGKDALSLMEGVIARQHPILLDRNKPLWKFHVVEGLPAAPNGRKQVGVYSQLHHAAVDGQAAVALANVILDVSPQPREIEIRPSKRVKTFKLDMVEMLRGALATEAAQVARIVRELPSTVGTLAGAAKLVIGRSSLLGNAPQGPGNLTLAPTTPMNASVTTGRAFGAVSLPLKEMKFLARAHEATLNDLVLMLVSTALRRHLGKHKHLPRKSLVAAVPISLRDAGDTASDNQASMSLISLGTHIADPRKRLQHIVAASKAMKAAMGSVKSILPTDFPSIGVPWLMEAAANLYGKAKVAERIPQVANVVISNVPGPQVPLYLAGARVLTNYPASIVVHGMGLNVTVQSFDQSMDFGLMADARAMPDVKDLAEALMVALDDVRALPLPGEAEEETASAAERVGRAARTIGGRVAEGVSGAVTDAVSGAVTRAIKGGKERQTARGVASSVGGAVTQAVGQLGALGRKVSGSLEAVTRATKPTRASAPGKARRSR
ncbi:MAG: wax ester/triacylglycerol synthase family O-acyltransferase [Rubrivivax sp.]|nr:wax ester/triacylglycerol synthase family O-acyltransferase [Rubrivivax sp.]